MALVDEILALPIGERIEKLKEGRGWRKEPNTTQNLKDWFIEKHDINDKVKYPDSKIVIEKGKIVIDKKTGKSYTVEDKTEERKVNHIALPIEQDIVNIQTAFSVGMEPSMTFDTEDDGEKSLISALKYTLRKNRIKYLNKKEMRSWLSEQEIAEYWYADKDNDNFWQKIYKKIKIAITGNIPEVKLKCALWSPFRGDKLYPFFENEDMTGFLREYKKHILEDKEITCYMFITKDKIYQWSESSTINGGWEEKQPFEHKFGKMPILYTYRRESYCAPIRPMRERLEKTLSQYADCLDYHFFPYLLLSGDVQGVSGKLKNHVIKLHGQGANASYLTWNQVPDTVKFEVDRYMEEIYSMRNTPRISFENLKGSTAPSGAAFQFYFMGAHMAVSNHAEDFGEFVQRRINFLITALGSLSSKLLQASKTIDIETDLTPYMINDISEKVNTAATARNAGIWSTKHSLIFTGNIDHIDEEMKEIDEDNKKSSENAKSDNLNKKDIKIEQ
jgi:hypothetical protein